jgi:predicted ArsR family transcriptional regulator
VAAPLPTRLDLLKALGDNTRYAIYRELAAAAAPRSTAEVAEALELHPNTVRPHLERMREVGLLAVETDSRGGVGRPQHLYSLADDAPSLGLEPRPMPLLARLLAELAAATGADPAAAAGVGRSQGRAAAAGLPVEELDRLADLGDDGAACLEALTAELHRMGFDPSVTGGGAAAEVAFTRCPFAELAEAHPEIVCHLHRGMVEGFVSTLGGAAVAEFSTLVDRMPCRVALASA